ncbi:MAG: sigma-70 family RNA polymerase sigma factor [Actinomycetota bacterium]
MRTGQADADPSSLEARPFARFFEDEYPRLVRLIYAVTLDVAEAEDVSQEAMVRAYERWDRVQAMSSPEGYVYSTALNLQRKRLHHLKVRARNLLHLDRRSPMESHVPGEILSALASISPGQRAAIVLVEWLGMNSEEAAETLRISPGSVRSRVHRAKQTLRASLGSDEDA